MQLEAVDIVKEEGAFKALVKEVTLVATKSTLVVEVVSVENNAVLNGLEIYSREVAHSSRGVLQSIQRTHPSY